MNRPLKPDTSWDRLVASARRAPIADDANLAAPLGFSTRVVAHAFARPESQLLERFSLRALGVAALLAVSAVVVTLNPVMKAIEDEIAINESDPAAAEVMDL